MEEGGWQNGEGEPSPALWLQAAGNRSPSVTEEPCLSPAGSPPRPAASDCSAACSGSLLMNGSAAAPTATGATARKSRKAAASGVKAPA